MRWLPGLLVFAATLGAVAVETKSAGGPSGSEPSGAPAANQSASGAPQTVPSRHHDPQVPFQERVAVSRVLVDARVLGRGNRPVEGLTADDFEVLIDGRLARVESAEWVGASPGGRDGGDTSATSRNGCLIVLLFQRHLDSSRIHGLVNVLRQRRRLLDGLSRDDRVAVLTFGSHLELTLDFTGDRDRLERALKEEVLFGPRTRNSSDHAGSEPSLRLALDSRMARGFADMDQVLAWLGESLLPLPGAKAVVLVGHGFDTSDSSGYGRALNALGNARASVFALDVTNADRHWLERGLQHLSHQTGGWFARAYEMPGSVLERVSGALAGYYVLIVDEPDGLGAGRHDIDVSLTRRSGAVYARGSYGRRAPGIEPE